jgi:hypothetical protein
MGSRLADALVEGGLVIRPAVAPAEACRRDHGGRVLEQRGIDAIDPVPLVSAAAPPPADVAAHLQLNDWMLAFARGRAARREPVGALTMRAPGEAHVEHRSERPLRRRTPPLGGESGRGADTPPKV